MRFILALLAVVGIVASSLAFASTTGLIPRPAASTKNGIAGS